MSENKIPEIAKKLMSEKKNGFEHFDAETLGSAMAYAEQYKSYLDSGKTEREATKNTAEILRKSGYSEYKLGDDIAVGGRYFYNNRDKNIYAFRIGKRPITDGIRILAAHIDSPRLDLKQSPVFEDNGLGYLKTHYYGGIRKYQWITLPLALHGTVILANGTSVDVYIGEDAGDPVFCITDLLPHLGKKQNEQPLSSAFNGENLSILIASSPYMENGEPVKENGVKLTILNYLFEKYNMTEDDFVSAELCAVPAGKCVDVGIDRYLIGAYGHDDTVCAYPALTALLESDDADATVLMALVDKEETGSDGNTGMQSALLCDIIDAIASALGEKGSVVRAASKCISADVTAGFDPLYADVFDTHNSAYVSSGVAMSKYTGSSGKYSTNDASAELVGWLRRAFADKNVLWQTAEMGKVDAGGGGTVAKYISKLNIDTVDIGVPVLSMHAPFEIISKVDLYSAHLAFKAFCLA